MPCVTRSIEIWSTCKNIFCYESIIDRVIAHDCKILKQEIGFNRVWLSLVQRKTPPDLGAIIILPLSGHYLLGIHRLGLYKPGCSIHTAPEQCFGSWCWHQNNAWCLWMIYNYVLLSSAPLCSCKSVPKLMHPASIGKLSEVKKMRSWQWFDGESCI